MNPREQEVYDLLQSVGPLPGNDEQKSNEPKKIGTPHKESVSDYKKPTDPKPGPATKVIQRMEVDYLQNAEEFTLLNPWSGVTWPGALIQGKSLRGTSVPTSIPIFKKRRPGRIMLQAVSGALKDEETKCYVEVEEMRESNVLQAQNVLLKRFFQGGKPPSTFFDNTDVWSYDDLSVKSGININAFSAKFAAAFSGSWSTQKSYVLVKLTQSFFTMSYEEPDGGFRGVFNDEITVEDLRPYTGDGNPICYVSSVTYGRVFYLLYESSASSETLLAAVNARYKDNEASVLVENKKVLNESRITMFQYGGDAKAGLEAATNPTQEQIDRFLTDGAVHSETNVGAPISFTVKHLYDNSLVHMRNMLKYEYDHVSFVSDSDAGSVELSVQEITVNTTPKGKYKVSNNGSVVLNELKIQAYADGLTGDSLMKEVNLLPRVGQRSVGMKYKQSFNVYGGLFLRDTAALCSAIRLTASFDVNTHVFHNGRKEAYHNSRLVMELKKENGVWQVQTNSEQAITGIDFRSMQRTEESDCATVNIQLGYRMYESGVRLTSQSK